MKFIALFIFFPFLFVSAQTGEYDMAGFKSDLKAIVSPLTSNAISLKFKVESNGQPAGLVNTFVLKRFGENYYTSNSIIEIINNRNYSLNIDHAHKIAILSKIGPKSSKEDQFGIPLLMGIDSLNFKNIKKGQDKNILSYSFFLEQVDYKIRYDTVSKKIIDYTLKAYDEHLRSMDIMVIKFLEQNFNILFKVEDYPMEKYIDFSGVKPKLTPAYKQYQFILKA